MGSARKNASKCDDIDGDEGRLRAVTRSRKRTNAGITFRTNKRNRDDIDSDERDGARSKDRYAKREKTKCTDSESDEGILCNDEDYETAAMIGNKMLLHMASAYRMIDGDKQDVVPEIKPLDQRKVLFEQLKAEYSLGELISEAKSQGVSRSSAIRWNNQWIEQGLINKENHGNYRKVA